MSSLEATEAVAGIVLVLGSLYDVFQSVVLPRPAVGRLRLSVPIYKAAWATWRALGSRLRRAQTREAFLAAFGPLGVLLLLALWAAGIITGFALIFHALRIQLVPPPGSFATAVYFSALSLFTLGFAGSITPTGAATRVLVTLEAATGLSLTALIISLLFSLFSSFQRREASVVTLDALAGAPPSGVRLLETCARDHMPQQLERTFDEWRAWTAEVLESHLAYPALNYFRSSHDNEAWLNSFGAVMDAAVLVLSAIEDGPVGPARLMFKVGAHLMEDIGRYFNYGTDDNVPGIEPDELEEACRTLGDAGYATRPSAERWDQFAALRAAYATPLNRLTRYLAIIPAPWIGDRSYLPHEDSRRRRAHRAHRPPTGAPR